MKIHPELKNSLDAFLRMSLCLIWLSGTIVMVLKFIGYQTDPSNVTLAWQASGCALVTIAAISAHAYLVDLKVKNG
jgi:hypothetical protein